MKRINPKTKLPFKQGDKREDGFLFDGYITGVVRQTGYYKEMWRSPSSYKNQSKRRAKNKREVYHAITKLVDKIKIGDLSYLNNLPSSIKKEIEKIGMLNFNGCVECGHRNPKHLDCHHKVKTLKDIDVASIPKTSWEQFIKIYKEMAKCEVYCSHHHRDLERNLDKNRYHIKLEESRL